MFIIFVYLLNHNNCYSSKMFPSYITCCIVFEQYEWIMKYEART